MSSRVITVALLLTLVLATAVLGLTFGGGLLQLGPPSSNPKGSSVPTIRTNSGPVFIVKAQMVSDRYVTAASELKEIPAYMFVPISNLRVVLAGLLSPTLTRPRGPIPNYAVLTNSSGFGQATVPRGNFTVSTSGAVFNFTTTLGFQQGVTTFLELKVVPTLGSVSSVVVVNQDTIAGVEPTATLYANVAGKVYFAPSTFSELKGTASQAPNRSLPLRSNLTIAVTVVGTYSTPQGTFVVLRPLGSYQVVPSVGDTLLQYRTTSSVIYLAG